MGVYRYQAVASLAREAARYASVHGTNYQSDPPAGSKSNNARVTKANIYNATIAQESAGLDLSQLTYTITYDTYDYSKSPPTKNSVDWDSGSATHAPTYVSTVNGVSTNKTATVTVTVNYNWQALLFFGTITLTSTSVMPMSY
jgi:hypothetical protein